MSDDRAEEIKKNILSPSQWTRIVFMALYGVAWWAVTVLLVVIVVAQALISLVTGRDNEGLRDFGATLVDYLQQLLSFLVYDTDEKPWPFSSGLNDDQDEDLGPATTASNDAVQEEPGTSASTSELGAESSSQDDVFSDMSFTESAEEQAQDENEADKHSVDFSVEGANAGDSEENKDNDGETKPSF